MESNWRLTLKINYWNSRVCGEEEFDRKIIPPSNWLFLAHKGSLHRISLIKTSSTRGPCHWWCALRHQDNQEPVDCRKQFFRSLGRRFVWEHSLSSIILMPLTWEYSYQQSAEQRVACKEYSHQQYAEGCQWRVQLSSICRGMPLKSTAINNLKRDALEEYSHVRGLNFLQLGVTHRLLRECLTQ